MSETKQILTRVQPEIAAALTTTAARLGISANSYVQEAIVRCIAADADRVDSADKKAREEIQRLAASCNELIQLTNRYKDGK